MDKIYTSEMDEKIFSSQRDDNSNIHEQIGLFLSELYERLRNNDVGNETEATMLVMPEAFAAKLNDNHAPHIRTGANLYRYLSGYEDYYDSDNPAQEIFKTYLSAKQNGTFIRIWSDGDRVSFAIFANYPNSIQTEFQLDVLKELLNSLEDIQHSNTNQTTTVGFISKINKVEASKITDKIHHDALLKSLEAEREHIRDTIGLAIMDVLKTDRTIPNPSEVADVSEHTDDFDDMVRKDRPIDNKEYEL